MEGANEGKRAFAALQIQNLKGRYAHGLSMRDFDTMLDCFARKADGVMAEIADSGIYKGFDGVERLMIHGMKSRFSVVRGNMEAMMLSSPVIEVARDCETAKGMWHSFGALTVRNEQGPLPLWVQGKYYDTFVVEDGRWKIRSMQWFLNFRTPFHKGWVEHPVHGSGTYPDVKPDEPPTWYMPHNPNSFTQQRFPPPPIED